MPTASSVFCWYWHSHAQCHPVLWGLLHSHAARYLPWILYVPTLTCTLAQSGLSCTCTSRPTAPICLLQAPALMLSAISCLLLATVFTDQRLHSGFCRPLHSQANSFPCMATTSYMAGTWFNGPSTPFSPVYTHALHA